MKLKKYLVYLNNGVVIPVIAEEVSRSWTPEHGEKVTFIYNKQLIACFSGAGLAGWMEELDDISEHFKGH